MRPAHRCRAEGGLRFTLRCLEEGVQLIRALHETHATATSSGCGFDHHRVAHGRSQFRGLLGA